MNLRNRAEGRLFLRPRRLAFVIAICLWTGATSVTGHEIGTTRVAATLGPGGGSTIVVSTDAAALLGRLEASAGRVRSGALDPHEYAERIESLRAEFVRHVRISFDGRDVTPAFAYLQDSSIQQAADPLTPAVATVRLSGLSPAHARTFVWRYDLTSASYTLTVHTAGGERATVWLVSDQNSQPFALGDPVASSRGRLAATYFALGFTHIVPHGLDHILFVLGIFLLNRRVRPILWQVSAFTIAHSITLGLTLYGVVSLAPATVEPLIALSIVYVAVENLVTSELQPWRIGLVFAFGLLHGMGFAGALRELGLPRSEFMTGLIAFNAGVEAGQLSVIGAAALLLSQGAADARVFRKRIVVPASALIALAGLYWTFARLPVW